MFAFKIALSTFIVFILTLFIPTGLEGPPSRDKWSWIGFLFIVEIVTIVISLIVGIFTI